MHAHHTQFVSCGYVFHFARDYLLSVFDRNLEHERVHFLPDVLVRHLVPALVHRLQQHVQEGPPPLLSLIEFAVRLRAVDSMLLPLTNHLSIKPNVRPQSRLDAINKF